MKWKSMVLSAALLAVLTVTPARALDYTISGPSPGDFGTPTSDETIYVGTEEIGNVDRSKNSALVPPGFGTPTSYLPGSGEPLTPNLAAKSGTVTAINPSTGTVIQTAASAGTTIQTPPDGGSSVTVYPGMSNTSASDFTTTTNTSVTDDLYYNGGYLGTLKIPTLDLSVKIYQGTDSATLKKGIGHFTNTSIWDGNVSLAAHNRGTNSYFGEIHTLDIGDTVKLTTKLGTRTYAVTSVEKISETDNSMLEPTSENCVTLFTCVRDQREYRWCVRAEEV